jgi:hypothetical protein
MLSHRLTVLPSVINVCGFSHLFKLSSQTKERRPIREGRRQAQELAREAGHGAQRSIGLGSGLAGSNASNSSCPELFLQPPCCVLFTLFFCSEFCNGQLWWILWSWTVPNYRYPVDRVPPHISFKPRQGAGRASAHCHMLLHVAMCLVALVPASLLERALALPRVPWLRTRPSYSEGLQCCHVPHGFGPRLSAQEGSGATTCPAAPDPASLHGRAQVLPHVPWPSKGRKP